MKMILITIIITQFAFSQNCVGDCNNGNGKFFLPNGDTLEGTFKDGYLIQGKYFFKSTNSWFEGEWDGNEYVEGTLYNGRNGDTSEGTFKDGKLIQGKYFFKSTNSWFEGEWDGNEYVEGTFYNGRNGDTSEGTFKDGKLFDGTTVTKNEKGSKCYNRYKNGLIIDGTVLEKYKDGKECYFKYKNGIKLKRICNYENNYNKKDIVSGPSSTQLNLQTFINGPKAHYLYLEINNKKVKFHFDTGCSDFTMNVSQWNELRRNLDYEDLKLSGTSVAIGADYNTKYYKILEPIKIGPYYVKNVIVGVIQIKSSKNKKVDADNLIGLGFFNKFSNVIWNMSEETIKLYF